jgi:hypothetical protein
MVAKGKGRAGSKAPSAAVEAQAESRESTGVDTAPTMTRIIEELEEELGELSDEDQVNSEQLQALR